MHTYWNCSRCHWCLMSRPLQSNQRDPLETERSPRAQELSPGASDGGQGARRHGENASWERGAKAGWHLSPFAALRGKRGTCRGSFFCLATLEGWQKEPGVGLRGRAGPGAGGSGCSMHTEGWGQGSLPAGTGLGLTETRQ